MKLDESHPLNRLVLAHLRAGGPGRRLGAAALSRPDEHPQPYLEAGSHPDVVERVWDQLGPTLPGDCRALVHGVPALVHPGAGVVLALAYGTRYALRLEAETLAIALPRGCTLECEWSGGGRTNVEVELGPGWVFGGWDAEEARWLAETHAALDRAG